MVQASRGDRLAGLANKELVLTTSNAVNVFFTVKNTSFIDLYDSALMLCADLLKTGLVITRKQQHTPIGEMKDETLREIAL
jgi:hypothetical protein